MTIEQYYVIVNKISYRYGGHTNLRKGQQFMNLLNRYYSEEYEKLTGTELDPFYSDDNLEKLRLSLGIYDIKGNQLQIGDEVMYCSSNSKLYFSTIKHFIDKSIVMDNTDYIALSKAHYRIYKTN